MRTRRTIVPVLLALVLLAGAMTPAAAQTDGPLGFEDIEGLQKAYARTFSTEAGAALDTATPGATTGGWGTLGAMVLEFDTEEHAAAGLDLLLTEILRAGFADDDSPVEDVELDIDIDHVAKRDVIEDAPWDATVLLAAAQDEATVALVLGYVYDGDPAPVVGSILTEIVEANVSDEPETFREDGTSTGGLWARLPGAERVQAEVPALVEVTDESLYPERSSPPAVSTPVRSIEPVTPSTPAG